jgi:hypothetical protein
VSHDIAVSLTWSLRASCGRRISGIPDPSAVVRSSSTRVLRLADARAAGAVDRLDAAVQAADAHEIAADHCSRRPPLLHPLRTSAPYGGCSVLARSACATCGVVIVSTTKAAGAPEGPPKGPKCSPGSGLQRPPAVIAPGTSRTANRPDRPSALGFRGLTGRRAERGTEESNLALRFWRPPCYRYTSPPRGAGHCRRAAPRSRCRCGRRDSNPQWPLPGHRLLRPACLPFSPRPRLRHKGSARL